MTTEPAFDPATAVPPAPEAAAPEHTPSAAELELKNWTDRALRAAAELENFRKRSAAEVADAKAYALTSFARDILPVADNLTRALEAPAGNEQALRDGVKMVAEQLAGVLTKHGVAAVEVIPGTPLNPDTQQPMVEAASAHPAGHVVAELQAGYTLNGRLLRPAFVSVSKPQN